MKIGLLRTIALCGACAAIAGAGSAALAADDDGPTTTGAPARQAGHKFEMRTCIKEPADAADDAGEAKGGGGETCTVTSGDGPPPGAKPRFGGCAVRVESGTVEKSPADGAAKKKLEAIAKEKCKGEPPPFGGCMKAEPGPADKAGDAAAAKAKKVAIAREKAAAAAA